MQNAFLGRSGLQVSRLGLGTMSFGTVTDEATSHLNRSMDNGLAQEEAAEVLTHIAFYSGWPTVFSALPVFREVFAARNK